MDFLKTLAVKPFMLYDGPMETRIKYGTSIPLDDSLSIFTLVDNEEGRHALCHLYEGDIATTEHYHAPIILNAPTFRASPLYCARFGYSGDAAVANINLKAINFVKDIRKKFGAHQYNIYVTAPIGPKQYEQDPSYTLDAAEKYHTPQAQAIVNAGVDIISLAAMPSAIETIGCAKAVANAVKASGTPYSVGVMISPEGKMLDGGTLKDLIERLDREVSPQPNFYILSCTHPTNARIAMQDHAEIYHRILGIKANGSSKPAAELFQQHHAIADDPEDFADELISLGKEFNFKIYGGCCGTDERHLAALARKLTEMYKTD